MKNSWRQGLHVLCFITCILLFTNCTKKDVYDPMSGKGSATDLFDFATTTNTTLKVDYGVKGYKAMFEVYTEDPVTVTEDDIVKKEGVEAIFKAYTDNDCQFTGVINLPTASSKVYIYSEEFGLPRCLEAEVTSSGINFNLKEYIARQPLQKNLSRAENSFSFDEPYDEVKNKYNIKSIGNWDKTGMPKYLENDAIIPDGLINRIKKTLPAGKDNSSFSRPTEITNINVLENAQISLIFVSEWASWKNTLGYYYYPTGKTFTQEEFEALPKYIALPNCSILGCLGSDETSSPLQPGNQIKLKYYGTDYKGNASNYFPQGITIGWFLIPGGFDAGSDSKAPIIYPNGRPGWKKPLRFSNADFNDTKTSSCVSIYDEKSSKVVIGFEDGGNITYNDVLFYIEATPDEAIFDPSRPETKPEEYDPTTTIQKGTLAFEDLWPRRGDYDMNDVVIRYNSTITKNKNNQVTKIEDIFTPLNIGGTFPAAFGYQLGVPISKVKSVSIVNGSSTAKVTNNMELDQEKATIMLFDDIHNVTLGRNITVTTEFDGTETEETILFPPYNPFICVGTFIPGYPRKEVHLPKHEPTSLVNKLYFGSYDDYTYIDKSENYVNCYMTELAYPFAINLPTIDYKISIEGRSIDKSYPKFKSWADSKGDQDKDWYLYPEENN